LAWQIPSGLTPKKPYINRLYLILTKIFTCEFTHVFASASANARLFTLKIYVFSTQQDTSKRTKRISKGVKTMKPKSVGGLYVTLAPQEQIALRNSDYIVQNLSPISARLQIFLKSKAEAIVADAANKNQKEFPNEPSKAK
jgi:hypothetical protein